MRLHKVIDGNGAFSNFNWNHTFQQIQQVDVYCVFLETGKWDLIVRKSVSARLKRFCNDPFVLAYRNKLRLRQNSMKTWWRFIGSKWPMPCFLHHNLLRRSERREEKDSEQKSNGRSMRMGPKTFDNEERKRRTRQWANRAGRWVRMRRQ